METIKKKKAKIWTYSSFHSFIDNGENFSLASQLYQTGIYFIVNNDPTLQGGFLTPEELVKAEKRLRKLVIENKITDLHFSPAIKVTTDDYGFLIQLKDETL